MKNKMHEAAITRTLIVLMAVGMAGCDRAAPRVEYTKEQKCRAGAYSFFQYMMPEFEKGCIDTCVAWAGVAGITLEAHGWREGEKGPAWREREKLFMVGGSGGVR